MAKVFPTVRAVRSPLRARRGVEGRPIPRLPTDVLVLRPSGPFLPPPNIISFHARSCSLNSRGPISRLRYFAPLSSRLRRRIGDICRAARFRTLATLRASSSRRRLVQFVQVYGARFAHLPRDSLRLEGVKSNGIVDGALT